MTKTLLPLFATLALSTSYGEESGAPLFNGKDLGGWQGVQGEATNWRVSDGVLTGTGDAGSQWLATAKEYADFDLSLEYKLPKNGNSGVFIRAPEKGNPWVAGMEIQLLDDFADRYKDLKPAQFTGSIYAVRAPTKRATKPAGQWQSLRIRCEGRNCEVWVNGEQVIDADLAKLAEQHGDKVLGLKRTTGLIGIQNHGTPVAFRNIRIKELGWVDLFNGKDLGGWHVNNYKHEPEWKVVDGVLTGHGGQGYVSSLDKFSDFELVAEARIGDTGGGRGNSGIYFRCAPHTDRSKEFPAGYEAQLDHGDSNNPTGSIYALKVDGARAPKLGTKDGEWVEMRIRAVGDHLQTWVDGEPAADCRHPGGHKKGSILLQMHHRTGKVEFRKVRIRRFGQG